MNCSHEIRYQSLFNAGRYLAFPCDAEGRVPLDSLSDSARESYLYARAVVGREYAYPSVLPHARR
jgi:lipocalin